MASTVYVAVDLGASSGRHLAGVYDGRRLDLAEIHRFDNVPVHAGGCLYWNVLSLWSHVVEGLRAAAVHYAGQIQSVGVDTWGVDFALLGRGDQLLANPVHYRDRRTEGMLDRALSIVSKEEIFDSSGLQFMQINTLYQVLAMKVSNSPVLEAAESFLMMPDLFHWLLTGVKANEFTNATTTQFFNTRRKAWATDLFDKLGLPARILGQIAQPGTRLGRLRPEVAADTNLPGLNVVLPGTHDTASAVMAVPAAGTVSATPDWCYISSGTWSLMGLELPAPVINAQCLAMNFTNEGGVGGTVRLLKNIAGLWLIQECRRVWNSHGQNLNWVQLGRMADEAQPLASIIDPDDPKLLAPVDMPQAIRDLCRESGQPVPESEGGVVRCALESLAMKYRVVLERLERLADTSIRTIHVVGGGAQNRQLCQMTADACGRQVIAGPVEATAIGNVMMQAIAAGEVKSIAQARDIIRQSFAVETYEPRDTDRWEAAYRQFADRHRF